VAVNATPAWEYIHESDLPSLPQVVRGSVHETLSGDSEERRYAMPKERGVYR
jgi:hypothetical protein